MASVDGSRSVQGASDELQDFLCGPCKHDKTETEARHYCEDCLEYLCNQCKKVHGRLAVSKDHHVVPATKVSSRASARRGPRLVINCTCNKQQQVLFYCEKHKDVVCDTCKNINHYKCKTSFIEEKSKKYSTAQVDLVLSKAKSLKDTCEQLKQDSDRNGKELDRSIKECKKQIKAFRKQIDIFLDKLERKILLELDTRGNESQSRIDQHLTTLKTTAQMLESDCTLLEDAKKDGRKTTIFASEIQVSKTLQDYERRLADIEKDFFKPAISFEPNRKLEDLQRQVKEFGSLNFGDKDGSKVSRMNYGENQDDKKVLLGRKVQSQRKVSVRSSDDNETQGITGITVMGDGNIALCDWWNNELKVMDGFWNIKESLKLSSFPWGVSAIDNNNVIVTLPYKQQLQHIQVVPNLKAGRIIQLDKKCYGIAVARDKMFVTCHNNPGEGEVRILDMNGKLLNRLGLKQDGSFMFKSPFYITVNKSCDKVFVSDSAPSTITCISVGGEILYQYNDDNMKGPGGLYCDGGDNIFVCGYVSHNIQVITAEGKKYGIILSSDDGIKNPYSIAYRHTDDTVIVGLSYSDSIVLFKLTK